VKTRYETLTYVVALNCFH